MIARSLIRRALSGWLRWRTTRKLYRALPELKLIDEARAEAKRKHRPYRHFDKTREALMAEALRGGLR